MRRRETIHTKIVASVRYLCIFMMHGRRAIKKKKKLKSYTKKRSTETVRINRLFIDLFGKQIRMRNVFTVCSFSFNTPDYHNIRIHSTGHNAYRVCSVNGLFPITNKLDFSPDPQVCHWRIDTVFIFPRTVFDQFFWIVTGDTPFWPSKRAPTLFYGGKTDTGVLYF